MFGDRFKEIQGSLSDHQIDGWLLYDYRGSNPFFYTLLEVPTETMLTRRLFYWIPAKGDPIKLVPQIEPHSLDHLPGTKWLYKSWTDLEKLLGKLPLNKRNIAMEYSPHNALPSISKVDAGTIDLMRTLGAEIVSSADLLQKYTSIWTPEQLDTHLEAAKVLCDIVDLTWQTIAQSLKTGVYLNEYQIQQFMLEEMKKRNCVTNHAPICAVNAHSADPHYEPQKESALLIKPGDFILIDLWCKLKQRNAVYADITRVAVAALQPTSLQQEIFLVVKKARDAATQFVRDSTERNEPLVGWQVDQICRDVIEKAGYGDYFIHRTGHNIGLEPHGPGANIDNFETHDFRRLLPGTCFSIEPGIYLPDQFGVRLEYDVYLGLSNDVKVTGGIQEAITCLV